jgi:hypothetical protein
VNWDWTDARGRREPSRDELLSKLTRLANTSDRQKFLARHRNLVSAKILEKLPPLVVDKIRAEAWEALGFAEAVVLIARTRPWPAASR